MTNREFMNAVIAGEVTEEMKEHAKAALEKMDATAEKRKGHKTQKEMEKAAANEALARNIATDILTNEAKTATDVAEILNASRSEEDHLSVQKVSRLCMKAVELGLAVQTDVKIPKKGQQKAYQIVEV